MDWLHLTVDESVFVREWARVGPMSFLFRAQWPAAGRDGRPDSRMVCQSHRQAALFIAHAVFGVPRTHETLLGDLTVRVNPEHALPTGEPLPLDLEIVCREGGRGGRVLTGLHAETTIRHDGVVIAVIATEFSWVSPAVYRRLRGGRGRFDADDVPPLTPVPAASVGRADPAEVTLAQADGPGRFLLRCDFADTGLFDHPTDHVPGLVLAEAAEQAAYAVTGGRLVPDELSHTFLNYVEFDEPCLIEAAEVPSGRPGVTAVEVTARQGDEVTFRSVLSGSVAP
ncbi:ScbA/BarX family gamma-butyrolactone biosynthesis protein [Streptomyces sp. NPDC102467]|uniref:ScbA/BarX family gamma-butyrolactone biosynthesis protein n=1 Tax=Streptomyces sp. NPDC102467 TaxID=3366179 RepID=UPI00381B0D1E